MVQTATSLALCADPGLGREMLQTLDFCRSWVHHTDRQELRQICASCRSLVHACRGACARAPVWKAD
eukprot:1161907-Pelagomonas_calceolata.AAC.14